MIEETILIKKEEGKTYDPLPEQIYQVEVLDITLTEGTKYKSTEKIKQLSFQFTLLEGEAKGERLRGRSVWKNFVQTSLYVGKNGKNSLYQIIEACIGRELSREEEMKGIDNNFLNALIGEQLKVFTEHKPSKDGSKIFDNIIKFMPAPDKLPALTEEEKEKARVKNTKGEKVQGGEETAPSPDF